MDNIPALFGMGIGAFFPSEQHPMVNIAAGAAIGWALQKLPSVTTVMRLMGPKQNAVFIDEKGPIYEALETYVIDKYQQNIRTCRLEPRQGEIKCTLSNVEFMKGVYDTFQNEQVELYIVDPKGQCETGNKLRAMFMSYVPFVPSDGAGNVSGANNPHSSGSSQNLQSRMIVVSSSKLHVGKLREYIANVCKSTSSIEASVTKMYVTTSEEVEKNNGNGKVSTNTKWDLVHVKTNKRLSNTVLSRKVEDELVKDVKLFFDSEQWYNTKGIPYKRGYILTGIPGSGKTSVVKSIAAEYNLPVFIIDFQVVTTNSEFSRLMKEISYYTSNAPYILALEDLDRSPIFDRYGGNGKISMPCLLNEIDGLVETHGRLLFITANDDSVFKEVSSNALIRPGRIDRTISIGACDFDQVQRLLFHFFGLHESIENLQEKDMGGPYAPAQIIEIIQSHMEDEEPDQVIGKLFKRRIANGNGNGESVSSPVSSVHVPGAHAHSGTMEEKRYVRVRSQLTNIQKDKRKIENEIQHLEKGIKNLPEKRKKYQKKIQVYQAKLEVTKQKVEKCQTSLTLSKEGLKKKKLKVPKMPARGNSPSGKRRRTRRRRSQF